MACFLSDSDDEAAGGRAPSPGEVGVAGGGRGVAARLATSETDSFRLSQVSPEFLAYHAAAARLASGWSARLARAAAALGGGGGGGGGGGAATRRATAAPTAASGTAAAVC